AVQGGVERTRSALSAGVSTVVGSRAGRLLATGVDAVLGKSEELVERYLPGIEEEPGEPPGSLGTPPHDPGGQSITWVDAPARGAELRGLIAALALGCSGACRAPGCFGARHEVIQPRGFPPAAVAAGVEVAPPEQPRRWQSYFVRVGSLSAKLRHRARRR
ncbi:PLIN3 protein, partial [Todus mexicanus]|nr:PLIN3 protein [Todus mexicanus]